MSVHNSEDKNQNLSSALIIDIDGFEGPLDVLLTLARSQKVDLTSISILSLADQYLAFINEARRISLELAADYLVMAAWLAYLKSKLLLPEDDEVDELSGPELAAYLTFRLHRLEAMRKASEKIFERSQLGREVFRRGMPEGVRNIRHSVWDISLFDLLNSYTSLKKPGDPVPLRFTTIETYSLEDALKRLSDSLGTTVNWERLESYLPIGAVSNFSKRSALASTLLAGLEMSRQGKAYLRQDSPFGPIYVKSRKNIQ